MERKFFYARIISLEYGGCRTNSRLAFSVVVAEMFCDDEHLRISFTCLKARFLTTLCVCCDVLSQMDKGNLTNKQL